jgi:hypothetical protein
MSRNASFAPLLLCALVFTSRAAAQPPAASAGKDYSQSPYVTRMMAFDKKHDGKLTRDEITDRRLLRLFDEADANKDGIVTKEELMALAAKKEADSGSNDRGGPDESDGPGAGGPGGPRDSGPGRGGNGPGGPRGRGGPPQPGQILSGRLQDSLKLTDDQKAQLAALQKEVDEKLAKILTEDQQKQLKEMRDRGPGGRGPGAPPGPPN